MLTKGLIVLYGRVRPGVAKTRFTGGPYLPLLFDVVSGRSWPTSDRVSGCRVPRLSQPEFSLGTASLKHISNINKYILINDNKLAIIDNSRMATQGPRS